MKGSGYYILILVFTVANLLVALNVGKYSPNPVGGVVMASASTVMTIVAFVSLQIRNEAARVVASIEKLSERLDKLEKKDI